MMTASSVSRSRSRSPRGKRRHSKSATRSSSVHSTRSYSRSDSRSSDRDRNHRRSRSRSRTTSRRRRQRSRSRSFGRSSRNSREFRRGGRRPFRGNGRGPGRGFGRGAWRGGPPNNSGPFSSFRRRMGGYVPSSLQSPRHRLRSNSGSKSRSVSPSHSSYRMDDKLHPNDEQKLAKQAEQTSGTHNAFTALGPADIKKNQKQITQSFLAMLEEKQAKSKMIPACNEPVETGYNSQLICTQSVTASTSARSHGFVNTFASVGGDLNENTQSKMSFDLANDGWHVVRLPPSVNDTNENIASSSASARDEHYSDIQDGSCLKYAQQEDDANCFQRNENEVEQLAHDSKLNITKKKSSKAKHSKKKRSKAEKEDQDDRNIDEDNTQGKSSAKKSKKSKKKKAKKSKKLKKSSSSSSKKHKKRSDKKSKKKHRKRLSSSSSASSASSSDSSSDTDSASSSISGYSSHSSSNSSISSHSSASGQQSSSSEDEKHEKHKKRNKKRKHSLDQKTKRSALDNENSTHAIASEKELGHSDKKRKKDRKDKESKESKEKSDKDDDTRNKEKKVKSKKSESKRQDKRHQSTSFTKIDRISEFHQITLTEPNIRYSINPARFELIKNTEEYNQLFGGHRNPTNQSKGDRSSSLSSKRTDSNVTDKHQTTKHHSSDKSSKKNSKQSSEGTKTLRKRSMSPETAAAARELLEKVKKKKKEQQENEKLKEDQDPEPESPVIQLKISQEKQSETGLDPERLKQLKEIVANAHKKTPNSNVPYAYNLSQDYMWYVQHYMNSYGLDAYSAAYYAQYAIVTCSDYLQADINAWMLQQGYQSPQELITTIESMPDADKIKTTVATRPADGPNDHQVPLSSLPSLAQATDSTVNKITSLTPSVCSNVTEVFSEKYTRSKHNCDQSGGNETEQRQDGAKSPPPPPPPELPRMSTYTAANSITLPNGVKLPAGTKQIFVHPYHASHSLARNYTDSEFAKFTGECTTECVNLSASS